MEKARAPLSIAPSGPDAREDAQRDPDDRVRRSAEATTRPKVTGNRMAICELTDWPVERDVPRFPCSALVSQCQYWTSKRIVEMELGAHPGDLGRGGAQAAGQA